MLLTPKGLLEHSRTDSGRRMIRYASTSAILVVGTQILILGFLSFTEWAAWRVNLTSTMLVSVPAFLLNKYWVWGKSGRAHLRREVIPFWVFTVLGWAFSTGAVNLADDNTTEGTATHTLAVMLASVFGFGVLWVVKYMFLDKIMFGSDHHTPYDEDYEREEAVVDARATPSEVS